MTFKYSIVVTKTIDMPHGNKNVDYVHLTNNPNFVRERLGAGSELDVRTFKGREHIQFIDFAGHHIDAVRYERPTFINEYKRVFGKCEDVLMSDSELHNKYRHDYILDLERRGGKIMKVLLRALSDDGSEILGTEFNYIQECKSLSSLLRTNSYKLARRNVDENWVGSYRIEEFTYGDNPRQYGSIT